MNKADRDALVSLIRFLSVWTIQGLWISLTVVAALAAITTTARKGLDLFALIGFLVWLFGFSIETLADAQKAASVRTRKTRAGLSRRGCGLVHATPIISVRSSSGWASPSLLYRSCAAGSGPP